MLGENMYPETRMTWDGKAGTSGRRDMVRSWFLRAGGHGIGKRLLVLARAQRGRYLAGQRLYSPSKHNAVRKSSHSPKRWRRADFFPRPISLRFRRVAFLCGAGTPEYRSQSEVDLREADWSGLKLWQLLRKRRLLLERLRSLQTFRDFR